MKAWISSELILEIAIIAVFCLVHFDFHRFRSPFSILKGFIFIICYLMTIIYPLSLERDLE